MKPNVGNIDRIVRLIVAAVLAILFYTNIVAGTAGVVLLALGGIFAMTALVGFCPLYVIFGLNTCSVKK